VYLARQESLDRLVAVKVLRRDVEDPRLWRDFRREAQTIARLSAHPNVVTVHTAGRSESGHPYLVTEYLKRGSLSDILTADGPLPAVQVATVGVAVADALAAAHEAGILHRDVKPGNVLLADDGRAKLGDFGIARLVAGQSITATDVIAFTPEHVAPEILRNEPDGPWSDLYGLGSTLAAALVGSSLFKQQPDERLDVFLTRRVLAPPPELPPSVPTALAGLLTRALDPEPRRRPSLTDFRQQLAAAAASMGAPVALPPPTSHTTTTRLASPPVTTAGTQPIVRTEPVRGPLRPSRETLMLIPALIIALVAAAIVIGVIAAEGDEGDGASDATRPSSVAPATEEDIAEPTVPAAAAPATVPAAAVPAAAPETTTTQATSTTLTGAPAGSSTPPSTSSPTTSPPPTAVATTASQPPARPAPEPSALVTAPEAEAFVRSYYTAIAGGDYQLSWSQLAPEFQRGKARSYDYYVGFWDENDIEVVDIALVGADERSAVVNVELRWNGSSDTVIDQFSLRAGPGGEPLIARQDTISG
jgi:hypothetical protein